MIMPHYFFHIRSRELHSMKGMELRTPGIEAGQRSRFADAIADADDISHRDEVSDGSGQSSPNWPCES